MARPAPHLPGRHVGTALTIAVAWFLTAGCGDAQDRGSAGTTTTPDDPAEVAEFCALVEEWAELFRVGEPSYRSIKLFEEVPAATPRSLQTDMATIQRIPPEAVKISDRTKRDRAVATVDRYVVDRCDVNFSFAELEFSPL